MNNSNKCQDRREAIAALVLGELEASAADGLRKHIDVCEVCRSLYEALADEEEMIRSAFKAIAHRTEMKKDSLVEQFDKQSYQPLLHGPELRRPWGGSRTMRQITKIAAAAVIIIVVMAGLRHYTGSIGVSSVAWGEVVGKVEQIQTFMFRIRVSMTGGPVEAANIECETVTYVSLEHGSRSETYIDGNVTMIGYTLPKEKLMISVIPTEKKYMRMILTDEQLSKMKEQGNDPRDIIKKLMSIEYMELGRDNIDGIEVEGIEVNDPMVMGGMYETFIGRLWVDVETDLPVRMEIEGTGDGGAIQQKMVMDGFEWDVELEASLFEPNIPADYTLMAELEMPDKDGVKAVEGLRLFAELTGGRYPSSMAMMTVMKEAIKALRESLGGDLSEEPSKEELEKMISMQMVCTFYMQLVGEKQEPAYYGDSVTVEDVDAVLMRWKISDDEYRVIFGDLTIENVSAERLAELEKLSVK